MLQARGPQVASGGLCSPPGSALEGSYNCQERPQSLQLEWGSQFYRHLSLCGFAGFQELKEGERECVLTGLQLVPGLSQHIHL